MLRVLGLSPDEQVVYEQLLADPSAVVQLGSGAHAGSGRGEILRRLEALGLVVRTPGAVERYAVVPVAAALDVLLAEQQRVAALVGAQLNALLRGSATTGDVANSVELICGKQEVVTGFQEFELRARREIRACESDDWPHYQNPARLDETEIEQLRAGIRYRVLYDRATFTAPGRIADVEAGLSAGEQARVIDMPVKMVLSDYPQAWLPVHRKFRGVHERLLVHDGALLAALSEFFEMQWERAVPLHVAGGRAEPPDAAVPSDTDRTLIRLLAAGLTEEAIADHLGWHRRTTQHRLRAMMAKLDARTRYQAGYQAVRRGWVTSEAV